MFHFQFFDGIALLVSVFVSFVQVLKVVEEFLSYMVLMNYIIPISMYVTVGMYHPPLPFFLTLPMLRLLSSKAHGCKYLWKPSKPCHVGIHWIALTEYSQMSTHMPGFQSFLRFLASFCIGQISHQQHKG